MSAWKKAFPMKIVIAPDSYKESLSALEVATEIEADKLSL